MKKEHFHTFLIVSFIFFLIAVIATVCGILDYYCKNLEISIEDYQEISDLQNKYPSLVYSVQSAMKDNKITYDEKKEIKYQAECYKKIAVLDGLRR